MPTWAITYFNIVVSVLGGGYLCLAWSRISARRTSTFPRLVRGFPVCKQHRWSSATDTNTSPPVISLVAGVIFSLSAANFVRPLEYVGTQENLNATTLYFSRLVLGVQLILAGVRVRVSLG